MHFICSRMVSLPELQQATFSYEVGDTFFASNSLSHFYDLVNETSYPKDAIYSVLESMVMAEKDNEKDDNENVKAASSKKSMKKKKQSAKMKHLREFYRKMVVEGGSSFVTEGDLPTASYSEVNVTPPSLVEKGDLHAFKSDNCISKQTLKETPPYSSPPHQQENTLKDDHLSSFDGEEIKSISSQKSFLSDDDLAESSGSDENTPATTNSYPDSFYVSVVVFNANN